MNILKELRKEKGFTQEELASKLGISRRGYQKWENAEEFKIPSNKVEDLAQVLEVTVGYLLGYSNEMTEYYFVNVAKANLLDILMETGFIKHSHIEYGLKKLDPIDRNLLEKEWSDDND